MARILLDYSGPDIRLFFRIFFCCCVRPHNRYRKQVPDRACQTQARPRPYCSIAAPDILVGKLLGLVGLGEGEDPTRRLVVPFMIFAFLLHLGSDFTTALLPSVFVQDRCKFGTGLVVSTNSLQLVPWNGTPYTVVAQAQITSLLNGGLQGVYRKANRALHFSADAGDLLGQWQCASNPLELDYPWYVSVKDTMTSLQQHGLLYDTPLTAYSLAGNVSHLVVVDTSAGENVDTLFDVRVSVDITAYGNETRHMQSYECTLNDTSGDLEPVQKGIHSLETLANWTVVFQGAVYDGTSTPASNNTKGILEQVLNSMTMLAGGGNYLLDSTQSDETQGCITQRTHILWELIVLSGLTLALVVFLLLYWLGLVIHLKVLSRRMRSDNTKWMKKNPPVGNFKWMAHAVAESQQPRTKEVKIDDLKDWSLGTIANGGGYGITKRTKSSSVSEEAIALRSNAGS